MYLVGLSHNIKLKYSDFAAEMWKKNMETLKVYVSFVRCCADPANTSRLSDEMGKDLIEILMDL